MENKFIATKYLNHKSTAMSKAAQSGRREDVINLSLGDPDLITNEVIITAAFEDARRGHTKYTDPRGDKELISEIIKFYKEVYNYEVEPDEVLITVGACHGMFLALESVINEGE